MPDVAVAFPARHGVHNGLRRINLVRPKRHDAFCRVQHEVLAHHAGEVLWRQKSLCKSFEVGDFDVVSVRPIRRLLEGVVAAVAQGVGVCLIFDAGMIPDNLVTKLPIRGADVVAFVDVVCLAERKESRIIGCFLEVAEQLVAAKQ